VGHENRKQYFYFIQNFILLTSPKESLFATLHLDFNSLKSGLLRLTGQPNSQKSREKVKDGIIPESISLGTV
jgi:hypothetical protein